MVLHSTTTAQMVDRASVTRQGESAVAMDSDVCVATAVEDQAAMMRIEGLPKLRQHVVASLERSARFEHAQAAPRARHILRVGMPSRREVDVEAATRTNASGDRPAQPAPPYAMRSAHAELVAPVRVTRTCRRSSRTCRAVSARGCSRHRSTASSSPPRWPRSLRTAHRRGAVIPCLPLPHTAAQAMGRCDVPRANGRSAAAADRFMAATSAPAATRSR